MLSEIFKAILITSLAGSLLAVVITLLKPVTKRIFGYSWNYYIWLAVLFVMILPVRFSLPQNSAVIPVVNTQTVHTDQITETAPTNIADAGQNVNMANTITTAQKATDFINVIINNRMNYLSIIWLLGIAICLLISIGGYMRLIIKIRRNSAVISCPKALNYTDRKITVRSSSDLSSPFMLGVFRPTLILPDKELSGEQLNNILRHEMTHFCRRDILYKWFTLIVRSVHWFNPLVYYIARQINNECEISCDLSVVSSMNGDEQISYVNTILSLVSSDRVKRIPLTTQMASGKRVLKRRFTMIKNVKKTSKFMSVVSAVIAAVMLSTTVFASGVLSDLTMDDYTVEFINNGEKIEFTNKPFVKNSEAYLPLREVFEKVGIMEHPDSKILWNDGKIDLQVAYYVDDAEVIEAHKSLNSGQSVDTVTFLYNYQIEIGNVELIVNAEPTLLGNDLSHAMKPSLYGNAPILCGSTTYVPFSFIVDMLNANGLLTNCVIYNKDGSLADISVDKPLDFDYNAPDYIVEQFFSFLEKSDFENMKRYCTQEMIDLCFHDGDVWGMKWAELKGIDEIHYPSQYNALKENECAVLAHGNVENVPMSAQYPSTSLGVYLILQKQADGRYLIDRFATGL